jgi:2-dehydropantoate 2-reductase
MRIAVFGAGSVGGYFGGRLAEAGQDVVFISRGDHLKAIQRDGLRVESTEGDFIVRPAAAEDNPAAVGPVDAILVCVKAWQVPEAAAVLRPMIGRETVVVPLQNGVEAPSQLEAVLGTDHVLGGLCRIISSVPAPGHIRHAGIDPYVAFGRLDKQQSQGAVRLQEAFSRAKGVRVEIPADIRVAMWRKFLLIAAWSGMGALTRSPIGLIRTQRETRQMLIQALQEIHAVAVAHQVALPNEAVAETLAFIDSLPPQGTASMQRDIIAGRNLRRRTERWCAWHGKLASRSLCTPLSIRAFSCSKCRLEVRHRSQAEPDGRRQVCGVPSLADRRPGRSDARGSR